MLSLLPAYAAVENQLSLESVKQRIEDLKNTSGEASANKDLEEIAAFLERAKKQQAELDSLDEKIKNAPKALQVYRDNIQKLTADLKNYKNSFQRLSSEELEVKQESLRLQLQENQVSLTEISSSLSSYRSALDQARKIMGESSQKIEKLTMAKYEGQPSQSVLDKYSAEISYLDVNIKYYALLGQNVDLLISIEEAKRSELNLKQQFLQRQFSDVQEVLNANRLKAYENQAKQAEALKANNKVESPVIHDELNLNTELSQYLVSQTQKESRLSQDSLRAKNVLDSLVQTKRNIEEQISALQGTLVLSRIINQQKKSLPTESLVDNLAKDTARLRVELFDYSQKRDELYNINEVIEKLALQHKVVFDESERKTLAEDFKRS